MRQALQLGKVATIKRGSWLSLVMLCAVTALATAMGFCILLAGATAVFAWESPALSGADAGDWKQNSASQKQSSNPAVSADQLATNDSQPQPAAQRGQAAVGTSEENGTAAGQAFSGVITDASCGARHSRNSDKTSADCARSCVRKGSRYVLVDGEEIHPLQGDRTQLDRRAGMRVEVVGNLVGDTIKVKSIAAH